MTNRELLGLAGGAIRNVFSVALTFTFYGIWFAFGLCIGINLFNAVF